MEGRIKMALTKMKMIRMKKDMKQWDVAQKANISETYLSRIENKRVKPNFVILKRIADVLNISPEELLEDW